MFFSFEIIFSLYLSLIKNNLYTTANFGIVIQFESVKFNTLRNNLMFFVFLLWHEYCIKYN